MQTKIIRYQYGNILKNENGALSKDQPLLKTNGELANSAAEILVAWTQWIQINPQANKDSIRLIAQHITEQQ